MSHQESDVSNVNDCSTAQSPISEDKHATPSSDSENDDITFSKPRKKVAHLSDSDSESIAQVDNAVNSDSDSQEIGVSNGHKSRIINNESDSDEDSNNAANTEETPTSVKSARVEEKRKKISEKFQQLLLKNKKPEIEENDDAATQMRSKISQLCDSESSDEEAEKIEYSKPIEIKKAKEREKAPQRMSAKQAMEQMQKIKSESNRMLREKEVYLPYHKPKQISLKDIMAKKNIQFVTGVQKPNIRMSEDQLREYAKQLEKREKEVLELYESENSEEDEDEPESTDVNAEDKENKSTESNALPDGEHVVENNESESVMDGEKTISQESPSDEMNTEEHLEDDHMDEVIMEEVLKNNVEEEKQAEQIKDTDMEIEIDMKKPDEPDDNQENSDEFSVVDLQKQHYEQLTSNKPTLKCSDGGFIDLTPSIPPDEEYQGINAFKKRFFYNVSLKTPGEIEREKEKKIQPGTALMNLRRELEDQIRENRLKEWEKKRGEELSKKREQNLDGDLSECEELLKDETEMCEKKSNSLEGKDFHLYRESEAEEEEELVEDDIVMKESKKMKCDYVEDEAELDEEEEDPQSDDDEEEEEDENDDERDECYTLSTPFEKKKLTRIIKPADSSDEEDQKMHNDTNIKESEDLFACPENKKNDSFSSDDFMPLGQKIPSSDVSDSNGKNISADNVTSLDKSIDSQLVFTKLDASFTEQKSHEESSTPQDNLFSTDSENIQNTQYLADLCSGKFPSQNGEFSQSTENELMELCTGKFVGLTGETNSQKEESDCNPICDSVSKNKTEVMTPESVNKPKSYDIKSFFTAKSKEISSNEEPKLAHNVVKDVVKPKYCISSSSDDEKENVTEAAERKKSLKSKKDRNMRRKAKPLAISDEESSSEDEDEIEESNPPLQSDVSENENLDDIDEKQIGYDSEENEIEMETEEIVPRSRTKKSSEFFEQEAELTDDDEWKGSGDEDERNLDEFEWEEGDADQLDQRKVVKELERIHRYQMLDQDNREIKLLQDILLEDGDLEGGTRERKFRWKNIDSNIESGAVLDDENNENRLEDEQSEEQWRRQRYERETFLRELKKKQGEEEETEAQSISRLSFIKSNIKSTEKSNKIENNYLEEPAKKTLKDLPSPVKKPLMLLQHNFKGSFLSRSQAALDRLASLAKTNATSNNGEPSLNINSLAPGKRRNFVFTTVSPPCNNDLSEDVKSIKRKLASEASETTNSESKKLKIINPAKPNSRKSLLDHID